MRAFKVYLNGKKLCLAGVGNDGVLTTTITYVRSQKRRETQVHVGGLVSAENEHVMWKQSRLRNGDELRVKAMRLKQWISPASDSRVTIPLKRKEKSDTYCKWLSSLGGRLSAHVAGRMLSG